MPGAKSGNGLPIKFPRNSKVSPSLISGTVGTYYLLGGRGGEGLEGDLGSVSWLQIGVATSTAAPSVTV